MSENKGNGIGLRKYRLTWGVIVGTLVIVLVAVVGKVTNFPWEILLLGFYGTLGVSFGANAIGDHGAFKKTGV